MAPPVADSRRARIFISYSRKDRAWLERLQPHLKVLENYGIKCWDDTSLEAGDRWLDEIRQAITSARVVILLVSVDFLCSDFIKNEELPRILAKAETEGAHIMSVILSPCLYEIQSISRFMSVNDPAEPLEKLNDYERNQVWVRLSRTILKVLQEDAEAGKKSLQAGPASAEPPAIEQATAGPRATPAPPGTAPPIAPGPRTGPPEVADRRFALLILNDSYAAMPTLSRLTPRFDPPLDLEEVLARKDIGGFQVTSLRNESAAKVTQEIQAFFANRAPDDVLFLYYSGIGFWYSGLGDLFGLAATDTQPDEIQTIISAYIVQGALRKCLSRQIVVVLDCRFGDRYPGDGAGRSSDRSGLIAMFQGEGRFGLAACNRACFSWEEGRSLEVPADLKAPPPLIEPLVRGLKSGKADLDGNRIITVGELFQFIEQEVAALAPEWQPCRWSFDQSKSNAVRVADAKFPGEDKTPTPFRSRYRVVQDIRLPILDLIIPTYILDKHFFFLDWNPAFDEVLAKPLRLVRGLHHAKILIQALENCEDVVRHARETFGVERQPLVDSEILVFNSDRDDQPRYGPIRFQKLAAQISDECGEIHGWSVTLNILEAGDMARLWKDTQARIEEEVSWSRYAVVYDTLLLEFPEYLDLVSQVTSRVGNARRCLDLGAGTGNGALRLLETRADREVWAIEINETMLRHFRGKLDSIKRDSGVDYSDRLTILKDNILRLDALPAKSFDAAVMVNVLYAVADRAHCLRNVNRVLKPGGALALSTPHRGTDVDRLFGRLREVLESKNLFEQYEEHFETARARHDAMDELIHRDTLDDLRALLEGAGFRIEELIPDQYVGSVAVIRAVKAREVERRDPAPGTTPLADAIEIPAVKPGTGALPPDAAPPDPADLRDVFVSYSRDDSALADEILKYLEARKIRCWIAPRDIQPGTDWPTAIVHAIARSRIMVFVLTACANQSDQATRELAVAAGKRVPVIPVRVADIPPSDSLAFYLSNVHWLDAFPGPLSQHLPRLAETITALLSKMAGALDKIDVRDGASGSPMGYLPPCGESAASE